MMTAYFITATILCLWVYWQTRATARDIRSSRKSFRDPWE
ncbi:hypothetical protein RUA4292_00248 [Ruegeria atlantica]|uniref:Uncharacterized protein n=1 Tax=Ruegeria atlantica TaxID=81569 RepID=A0A0N7LPT1_9RHOB|nr:hypothetical protein RUA4292_00248 [Ruegeria atlantica]